jgi:hypothetical protein
MADERTIEIDDAEIRRIIELENDVLQIKKNIGELEISKWDEIENLKIKIQERMSFTNKLKTKYKFSQDNFIVDVQEKKIKFQ